MCVNENSVNYLSILQPVHLILYEEENLIKYAKQKVLDTINVVEEFEG